MSHPETQPGSGQAASVVIRATRLTDVDAMTALYGQPGFRAGTLHLPFQGPEQTRKVLESRGADDLSLVAERDGKIVGSAGWNRFAGRRSHAAAIGMGIDDAHVGQGIGAALLSALVDSADNWFGIRRLELTVFADNAVAIRLYRRFGFEPEGTLRDYALQAGRFVDASAMARICPKA